MNCLLMAMMYPDKNSSDKAIFLLKQEFGNIKAESLEYDFTFTDYYEDEFGKNLKKKILVFEKTIEKRELVKIREKTGQIEQQLSKDNKRTVNIDPGYISKAELVLATKKGRDFKEDLGSGIFAHKVLGFKDDEVITFFHTFADYKLEQNIAFFKKVINLS